MDLKQAVITSLGVSDFVVNGYLGDLTQEELLTRPCPGANHIAWQVGHLISSERYLVDKCFPGKLKPLPDGFDAKHKKDQTSVDSPGQFLKKEEYLRLAGEVRKGVLGLLETATPADFDRPVTGVPPFLKTVGEVFIFLGSHWIMHAGQWAVIRRKCGRPPLF